MDKCQLIRRIAAPTRINMIGLLIVGCITNSGCRNSALPTQQRIESDGVVLTFPPAMPLTHWHADQHGTNFRIDGIAGTIHNKQLSIRGRDYGEVKSGVRVAFQPDGSFTIDDAKRTPRGWARHVIENEGVAFAFESGIKKVDTAEDGSLTITTQVGRRYTITQSQLIFDEHSYGPFAAGNFVSIERTGAIIVDL